ncbi:MAG: SDR family oxidoreductase [Calditrichaeota bacterium]|nr:SDR family oxidoreductase [Calditrichota bacterium]
MKPTQKTVVITGGTGGLGRAVVAAFLADGARVWTNYRREDRFQDLQQAVSASPALQGISADLTDEEQVQQFFDRVLQVDGHVDVLIHLTGGFWMGGEIADTPLGKWDAMMRLNLLTTFLCTRKAFQVMKQQLGGRIFTVASRTALDLPAGMGAYSVSKAGVIALTQVLANEGKAYNITANVILPSIIDTPANRQAMPDADYSKWVTPEDIARLLVQLCRDDIRSLSGTEIKMYGKL